MLSSRRGASLLLDEEVPRGARERAGARNDRRPRARAYATRERAWALAPLRWGKRTPTCVRVRVRAEESDDHAGKWVLRTPRPTYLQNELDDPQSGTMFSPPPTPRLIAVRPEFIGPASRCAALRSVNLRSSDLRPEEPPRTSDCWMHRGLDTHSSTVSRRSRAARNRGACFTCEQGPPEAGAPRRAMTTFRRAHTIHGQCKPARYHDAFVIPYRSRHGQP